jgi:signal-transduction protein with cAMP-binding, CBS, and nucleotidyltransferase domain
VGSIPVVDEGELIGILTDRDIVIRVVADRRNPMEVSVREVMTATPHVVSPDTKLSAARELMERHRVRRLAVTKGDQLVGILSLGDVAWADASAREVGQALKAVSESDSTRELSEDAIRGTPQRVRDAQNSSS